MVLAALSVELAARAAGFLDWPDQVAQVVPVAVAALAVQELQALMAPVPEWLVRTAAMAAMAVMVVPAEKVVRAAEARCCSRVSWAVSALRESVAQAAMLELPAMAVTVPPVTP